MAPGFSTTVGTVVAVATVKSSFFLHAACRRTRDAAILVVCSAVAGQRAGICGAVVGNGRGPILGNDADIKIHQPLAADIWVDASYAVRGVTYRTAEAGGDMALVLAEAGVRHDVAQVVALAAHCVRPVHAEVGISKQ